VLNTGFNFEKSGTVYIISLIWMILIISTLLSTLIDNIVYLRKTNKRRRAEPYNILDFELGFTIKMDFWSVFKISINNTFKEPIFYLFTGIFVLPLFQEKDFTEPFKIVNVLIVFGTLGLGMIILSFLNSVLNYIQTYGSGKVLNITISHHGLYFKNERGVRHIPKSRIRKFHENDLFLIFGINRFSRIYILKDLFETSDLQKIRKNLS